MRFGTCIESTLGGIWKAAPDEFSQDPLDTITILYKLIALSNCQILINFHLNINLLDSDPVRASPK